MTTTAVTPRPVRTGDAPAVTVRAPACSWWPWVASSTPAGSSAYARAMGATPVPLTAPVLTLAAVALESDASGWATDLQGRRHELSFRALRTPGFVDQVAVLDVRAPDTLHFHLTVAPRGQDPKQLDFVREFLPR